MLDDTIAAISTPLGEGGIGIVRISGPQALAIARRIFPKRLRCRHLTYGHIVDPETGETVDEVLAAYMAAPHTYTREDVVEINCHGGPIPLQRVLGLALREGARLAHPGEFTLRAFLNGRLDLAQAEAVLDIIQAKTNAARRLAVSGLQGRLSHQVKALRQTLLDVLALLTARIDFPDDEIEGKADVSALESAREELGRLLEGAKAGIIYRQGVRVALAGRPNVGKSSLLNALLQRERAIVSPLPGTTRDTIEDTLSLRGIPFILVDTAGIGASADPLQDVASQRSRTALEAADLVLMIVDISQPLTADDYRLWELLTGKLGLLVANKCDLPRHADLSRLDWPKAAVSALTGEGLPELEQAIVGQVLGGHVHSSDEMLVTSPRHQQALARAYQSLDRALAALRSGLPDDLATIDLTDSLNALGEITGETVGEDLLDSIFSQFCVGK